VTEVSALQRAQSAADLIFALPMTGAPSESYDVVQGASTINEPLSPIGRLAYCSNESGRNEVYVQRFPISGERWQVRRRGVEPNAAGRKELYYLSDQKLMALP